MSCAPIVIERTFVDLPENEEFDPNSRMRWWSGDRHQLTWHRLLESSRVLIVSEAGMGKTVECRRQQERLWDEGQPAFYIELSALAQSPLESQLLDVQVERLQNWRSAQSERATFFLDSIDELKLTLASFDHAIKMFASAIGTSNMHRARIVLTTRPIPIDRGIIKKYLDIPEQLTPQVGEDFFARVATDEELPKLPEPPPIWRHVALSPLTTPQMREMANQCGVTDINQLLEAVDAQNAHDFTQRPLDFLELCGDWKTHGYIRSHREQLVADIDAKLRPREDRRELASLSADVAREGAERLALAVLLSRRFTLWHGLDGDRSRGDGALDPRRILTNWSEDKIRALLERPLFGFATYGRVRFHHLSVVEFLAAEHLRTLVDQGMSNRTLARLLFATTPAGIEILKPAMQSVAAWLSATKSSVRDEVLRRDPSLLLRQGDPASLAIGDRIRALTLYVERYGPGNWRGQQIPPVQIRRAASPQLGETIARLWERPIENPEVRETLLQLIGAGSIVDCADIAFEAMTIPSPELGPRLHALQALVELRDQRLGGLLDRMATDTTMWPNHLVTNAITHLFPRHLSIDQLLGGLSRFSNQKSRTGLSYLLPMVIGETQFSATDLARLRQGLVDLIEPSITWDHNRWSLKSEYKDLVPALLASCRVEYERGQTTPEWTHATALSLRLSKDSTSTSEQRQAFVTRLMEADVVIREKLTWCTDRIVCSLERRGSKLLSSDDRLTCLIDHPAVEFAWSKDSKWLVTALGDSSRPHDERALALKLSQWLLGYGAEALPTLLELRLVTEDDQDLVAAIDAAIYRIEHPQPEPSWLVEDRRRREKSRRKQAKRRADWIQFWRAVMANPSGAFSPTTQESTTWNLWQVMRKIGRDGVGWNRGFIERAFNTDIADDLHSALKHFWRKNRPTTRSERPPEERNTYLVAWTMGLAGVYAEAETPGWATRLNAGEAELATRYALLELNHLPPWLKDLVEVHPGPVETLVGSELVAELNDPAERSSSVLQNLARSAPSVRSIFFPHIRTWLHSAWLAPTSGLILSDKLRTATRILAAFGPETDREELKVLAKRRLRSRPNQEHTLFWLSLLFDLDPAATLDAMENLAATIKPNRMTKVTVWLAELFGHRAKTDNSGLLAMDNQPQLLLRAARLACRHVRYSDDVDHDGARSHDARDGAEYARSAIVNMLLNARGMDAWRAKLEFRADPEVASFRDRVLALAEQTLASEWDAAPMDEIEIVALEKQHEFSPGNRADMAGLLHDRLSDIEELFLLDTSPREAWATYKQERLFRKALARELEAMARTAYTVNQEAVTGDERETDIRLTSTRGALEAVIELKVAEQGYTVADYESALRDQLVTRYMAPEHRRVGCLMISIAKNKRWRHPTTGHYLTHEQLLIHLNSLAENLVQSLGEDAYLTVRFLDLRPRNLTPNRASRAAKKRVPGKNTTTARKTMAQRKSAEAKPDQRQSAPRKTTSAKAKPATLSRRSSTQTPKGNPTKGSARARVGQATPAKASPGAARRPSRSKPKV